MDATVERKAGRTRLFYDKKRRSITSERRFLTWGQRKENGIWISSVSDWRLKWLRHDALYVAAGRLRLRFMKRGA